MTVRRWRHLPVIKEAVEYTADNAAEIVHWSLGRAYTEADRLIVVTPGGDLECSPGDFVVRGIEGEYYPVPRSIFIGSYEPMADPS
jgi:hypothetical protein